MISLSFVLNLLGCKTKWNLDEEEEDLPTSPGLTKPELALRQGIEAAVFITLGASTMMIGDPTLSFDFGRGGSFAISQHLTVTRAVKDPLYHRPDCILGNLVEEAKEKAMEEEEEEATLSFG